MLNLCEILCWNHLIIMTKGCYGLVATYLAVRGTFRFEILGILYLVLNTYSTPGGVVRENSTVSVYLFRNLVSRHCVSLIQPNFEIVRESKWQNSTPIFVLLNLPQKMTIYLQYKQNVVLLFDLYKLNRLINKFCLTPSQIILASSVMRYEWWANIHIYLY